MISVNNSPKISVITVCYNAKDVIEETMLSVIQQVYSNVEYIIIDGKSNDGTVDIIKKYEDRISYWVSEPDKGIYDAMNKGIAKASGDYINFMNAGDRFYDEHVLEIVAENSGEYDVIYGDTMIKYDFGELYKKGLFFSSNDFCLPLGHQSTFVKTKIIRDGFDTKYKIAADYNMLYNLYKSGHKFIYVDKPLSVYDMQGFSSSRVIDTYSEVATINGTKNTVRYYINVAVLAVKQFVRGVVPTKLVRRYRRLKYKATIYSGAMLKGNDISSEVSINSSKNQKRKESNNSI